MSVHYSSGSQLVRKLDFDSFFDNDIISLTTIIMSGGRFGLKLIIAFVKIPTKNKTRREKKRIERMSPQW